MKSKWILMTAFAAALSVAFPGMAQTAPAKTADQSKSSTKSGATAATTAPTDKDISDAKSKGMVWVNTSTRSITKMASSTGRPKKENSWRRATRRRPASRPQKSR